MAPRAFGAASTKTWDGEGATGVWATGSNWSGNTAPATGDFVVFNADAANTQYAISIGAARSVGSITFGSGGSNGFSFSDAFTITVSAVGGITNNNAATQVFNSTVLPSASQTWNAASGGLSFANLTFSSNITLTLSGSGAITSSGTATLTNSLTLAGTNGISLGTLVNSGNNRTLTNNSSGTVTIGAINLSEGPTTGRTLTISGTGNTTVSGAVANNASGAGSLTKTGAGTLTLNGASTYSGTTTLTAGTIEVGNDTALGTSTLSLNAGTLAATGGARTLSNIVNLVASSTIGGTQNLTLNGAFANTSSGAATLTINNSGLTTLGSTVGLSNRILTVAGTGSATFAGVVSGTAGITLNSTGALTLSGNNTYSGSTTATTGTLLAGHDNAFGTSTLTLGGAGVGGSGSGLRTIGNVLNLNASSSIAGSQNVLFTGALTQNASSTLTVNNSGTTEFSGAVALSNNGIGRTLTLAGAGNTTFSGVISNGGTSAGNLIITKSGDGTITLSGGSNNTFSGTTTINSGTLVLAKSGAAIALAGNITIGDGSGTDTLRLNSDNQIASSAVVTFTSGGVPVLDLGGYSQTLASVSSSNAAALLALGTPASATFTVGDSSNNTFAGAITGGANAAFTKTGSGSLTLSGTNTYSGTTTVSQGTLIASGSSALGATTGAVTVNSGATLSLTGGITLTKSATLTLNGSGVGSNGALRNVGGSNTYNGLVNLDSDSRINADGGSTLTIANTNGVSSSIINGTASGKNLTVGGAGSTVVNGGISSFVNNLTKDGSGTLTLAGLNTYAGATSVAAGAVKLTNDSGLSGTGVTVTSGAALQFAQTGGGINISVVGVGSTINGTGLSNGGAIENLTGNNSYAGLVTLGSSSLITAKSSTSLTLSGGIATAGQTLTVGTTGNNGNIAVSGNVTGSGDLTKAGSGSLTFSGAGTSLGVVNMDAGTLSFTGAAATTGAIHLNAGSISFGGATTANTGAIDSGASTTLTIATGGTVIANYPSGATTFSGNLAGGGTFQKNGTGILVFDNSFTAPDLTLTLNGGTLSLLGAQITVGTIRITGNTILDFNNSAGTFLSSANLQIDDGVVVTVQNWVSVANNAAASTIWYATHPSNPSTVNGLSLDGTDQVGGTPLNQVSFAGNGLPTTWVSGSHSGWFDHEIRPTPEPSTYGAILVTGCLGLLGWRRRRHARATR